MTFKIFLLAGILTLRFVSAAAGQDTATAPMFRVVSPAFENGSQIPRKFGCGGENVNPPLRMENIPPRTKSIALLFDDLDAPRGTYVHWIVWNIAPGTGEIRENSVPEGSVQGTNDFKKQSYGGPCPPTRPHRYVFKVYALDTLLDLGPAATKPDLEKAMKGHVLAQSQLKGSYPKK